MTNPNFNGRKNQKITFTASLEGVKKAESSLKRLGFESKSNFAKSQLISRSTVTKFFQRKPIQLDSFKRICNALRLNWETIAEIPPELENSPPPISNREEKERQVIVIDKESKTVKVQITLKGDINSASNIEILEVILRKNSGDTIKIIDIKPGSIKLFITGSQEDIQKLLERINSGKLTEVDGLPVKDIKILDKNSLGNESDVDKWSLVQEVDRQGARGKNLSGADLSDADLSGADLSGAYLSDADLSGADLRGANLSDASLINADLSGADLSGVNLTGAKLTNTNVERTQFRNNSGITKELESDLLTRGAICPPDSVKADTAIQSSLEQLEESYEKDFSAADLSVTYFSIQERLRLLMYNKNKKARESLFWMRKAGYIQYQKGNREVQNV